MSSSRCDASDFITGLARHRYPLGHHAPASYEARARPTLPHLTQRLAFSLITRYEVLRGLMARHATAQLRAFERFCQVNEILPLTDAIIVRAAELYADLHRRGQLIGDADILIAATALENGRVVITNNESHFNRLPGLQVHNWLQ